MLRGMKKIKKPGKILEFNFINLKKKERKNRYGVSLIIEVGLSSTFKMT